MSSGVPPRAGPLRTAGLALAFGAGWFAVEWAAMALTDPDLGLGEIARRGLRFLPWHLAAFAAMGAALLLVSRRLSAAGVAWWLLAGAIGLFGGVRVAEGALHHASAVWAAARWLAAFAAAGAFVAVLAAAGRLLPPRLRPVWPLAACAGTSIAFIGFLRTAGPGIGLGETGLAEAARHVGASSLGAAAAVTVALLLGGAARERRRALGLVLVLAGAALTAAPAGAAAKAQPDVYVFLLDTLRQDHLGTQPDGSQPTPALEGFEPEFVRFRSAWSPSTRTSRSMPGILASLSVRVTGSPVAPEAVTLAERLRDAGWATLGVSANPLVSRQFGLDQGFDSLTGMAESPDFLVLPVLKLASAVLPGPTYHLGVASADLFYPPIEQLRRRALAALDRSERPTLLYAQTMDVHGPYLPPHRFLPPEYRRGDFLSYYEFHRLSGSEALLAPETAPRLENVRQRYAAGVRHTAAELAEWFDALRARGRWDEALVWIVSDHGEAFGEHGYAGHGYSYVGAPVVHVPLWVKPPRSSGIEPRVIDEPVSSYDLLPTTLGLLGLAPVEPAFGIDLSARLRGAPPDLSRTVVIETDDGPRAGLYAAVRGRFKLAVRYAPDGSSERRGLHDLEADPGETRDVSAAHPEVVASLEQAIRDRRAAEAALSFQGGRRAVDPQTRERLRALGYLDE